MDYASVGIGTALISTTNDIKMAVYKNSDSAAIVQSITESGTHAPRIWFFDNLERVTHFYKLLELDGTGTVINTILGPVYFVPSNQTFQYKPAKLIQAGVTPIPGNVDGDLWPTNVNTVTVPDWIGWQIESFVYPGGIGELKYDQDTPLDMSYDPATGVLQLNGTDIVFQPDEYYIAHFAPKIIQASGGIGGAGGFAEIKVITSNTTLDVADIGKKILIAPSGNYLEVTLPDYATVAEDRITYFEFDISWNNTNGYVQKCAAIKTHSGQVIQWMQGSLSAVYMCPSESFEMYKRAITSTSFEWRIQNADGNFKAVGKIISDDASGIDDGSHNMDVLNEVLCDGRILNNQQYARLYQYVLSLNSSQVLAYASWNGSNITTYTKWSYADGSGNFHIPDLRKMFLRMTDGSQLPGIFVSANILSHQHEESIGTLPTAPFGRGTTLRIKGDYNAVSNNYCDMTSTPMQFNTGTGLWEAVPSGDGSPMHRITNFFVRC